MKRTHRTATLLLAPLAAASLLAAAPGTSEAESPPAGTPTQVVSASLTGPRVPLVGAQVGQLVVRLRLVDPDGVAPELLDLNGSPQIACPCVILRPTSRVDPQGSYDKVVALRLESGTPQDGTWVGTAQVVGADLGTWQVTHVGGGDLHREGTDIWGERLSLPLPAGDALPTPLRVAVRASDWLRVTLRLPAYAQSSSTGVHPLTSAVVTGSATTAYTGRPVGRVQLQLRTSCGTRYTSVIARVATNASGQWSRRLTRRFGDGDGPMCLALAAPVTATAPAPLEEAISQRAALTLGGMPRSVRAGTTVRLTATVQRMRGVTGTLTVWLMRGNGTEFQRVRYVRVSGTAASFTTRRPRGVSVYALKVNDMPRKVWAASPSVVVRAS